MSEEKPLITFTPVPVRPRRDGWTVERQIIFLEKLADGSTVTAACKHVGMSRESARKLRRHALAGDFRDAWDAATDCRYAELEEAALERSTNGVARPIFYKGEQVGEWRQFDERLTMFLLRFRRRQRFGPKPTACRARRPICLAIWTNDSPTIRRASFRVASRLSITNRWRLPMRMMVTSDESLAPARARARARGRANFGNFRLVPAGWVKTPKRSIAAFPAAA